MNIREPFSNSVRGGLEDAAIVTVQRQHRAVPGRPGAQQAYVFSEPLVAAREGVETRCLMVAELGFRSLRRGRLTHERTGSAERPALLHRSSTP